MPDDLKNLEDKIAQMKAAESKAQGGSDSERENRQMSVGMQAGTEFSAYVISGAVAGFFLDHIFGTLPLMLVILLFTGFGYGIFRAAKIMQ